jgi:hypothetical protein
MVVLVCGIGARAYVPENGWLHARHIFEAGVDELTEAGSLMHAL